MNTADYWLGIELISIMGLCYCVLQLNARLEKIEAAIKKAGEKP